jgi:hypothetical protein
MRQGRHNQQLRHYHDRNVKETSFNVDTSLDSPTHRHRLVRPTPSHGGVDDESNSQ